LHYTKIIVIFAVTKTDVIPTYPIVGLHKTLGGEVSTKV